MRGIKLELKEVSRGNQEMSFCILAKCEKCGKEFYTIKRKHNYCKACKKKKAHRRLLDEQYRLAARLGLLKK